MNLADFDGDLLVTNADIQPFLDNLIASGFGAGSLSAVPEPDSGILLGRRCNCAVGVAQTHRAATAAAWIAPARSRVDCLNRTAGVQREEGIRAARAAAAIFDTRMLPVVFVNVRRLRWSSFWWSSITGILMRDAAASHSIRIANLGDEHSA